ncbi:MAG: hypothetical protein JWQ72_1938 [Polaromonas sp.]|nr:hypothetical protein [Polaromonas sp.]
MINMKGALCLALSIAASYVHAAGAEEPASLPAGLEAIRASARGGDYGAQRNLAFTYATGGSELKGKRYPVAGCAWYMSIPYLHPKKFDGGDAGNTMVYCGRLSPDDYDAALRQSVSLVESLRLRATASR